MNSMHCAEHGHVVGPNGKCINCGQSYFVKQVEPERKPLVRPEVTK